MGKDFTKTCRMLAGCVCARWRSLLIAIIQTLPGGSGRSGSGMIELPSGGQPDPGRHRRWWQSQPQVVDGGQGWLHGGAGCIHYHTVGQGEGSCRGGGASGDGGDGGGGGGG